jgi:MFS superfamily sulfate permease-like transporter
MTDRWKSYLKEYKSDLPASLVVFLVALPLCLGIALASGAPLFSGIITGVIGGIVVGMLSGSPQSVSGPAAGLTVIVLNAITELGTWELFLTAVVLAGVIQLVFGYVKAGIIGLFFPSGVIKGMLAAIGLILIIKQLPYMLGIDTGELASMPFVDEDGGASIMWVATTFKSVKWTAMLIGFVSLTLLILWERPFFTSRPFFKLFPGALAAVIAGVLLNLGMSIFQPELAVGKHLVNLPILWEPGVIESSFAFPDWSGLTSFPVWKVAFVIALIASLETLLSVEAVDKLDPLRRHTPKNRELKAQGAGNLLAGLIGGLPMTAVIVRSSANINAGGKTKMSAIYHGILLAVSVITIPYVLNMIPLASLAAVLIVVGYKLAKPSLFKQQWARGMNQFLPFIITILAILATDLLTGIIIGMGVGIFFILRANYKTPYYYRADDNAENGERQILIHLSEHVSFLNKASLQLTLDKLPENSTVVIDGMLVKDIDHDALIIIRDFQLNSKEKNITVKLVHIPGMPETFSEEEETTLSNRWDQIMRTKD